MPEVIPLGLINTTASKARLLGAYKAADAVNLYIPPLLIVIGCVVNVLIIVVMRTSYFRNVSTSLYMITGSVNDTTGLCIALLTHWLFVNHPEIFAKNEHSIGMCRFFNFYGTGNTDVTVLLTAAMTSDRAYAIHWPVKAATKDLRTRAKVVIGMILAVVAAKNTPLLFSSDMSDPQHTERLCIMAANGSSLYFFVEFEWPWIQVIYYGLCLLIILFSNAIIIHSVRRSAMMADIRHAGSSQAEAGGSYQGSPSTRLRQITVMMLLESFAMLVLSYPFSWYSLCSDQEQDTADDPDKVALHRLLFSTFFYMMYANKCINFFLYVASGSKFRLALVNVLRPCRGAAIAAARSTCAAVCARQERGQGQRQEDRKRGENSPVGDSRTTLFNVCLES